MQKPAVPAEVQGPFDELLRNNPFLGWVVGGASILIIVVTGYYMIDFFRKQITEDPNNDPVKKMSELEQLKSTAYMTEEEKKRLNASTAFGKFSPTGPLDPELAEFRKIKQMRVSTDPPEDEPTFEEIDDQPEQ